MPVLKNAKRAILLTGTPTLSRAGELLPQLRVRARPPWKGGWRWAADSLM